MKKPSFSALVYREFLICRKSLMICLFSTLIFSIAPILVALSIRYGNMAMLPENILSDIQSNNNIMLKVYAVISPCIMSISFSEASIVDMKIQWERFRKSTTISPTRMAFAKYIMLTIILVFSFLLAFLFMGLCTISLGIPMAKTDIAVIMSLITLFSAFSILGQFFIMLMRSVDRGMLLLLGVSAISVFLIPEEWRTNIDITRLLQGAETLLPFTPVIIMGLLTIGFVLTIWLFKRREK